MHSAMICRPDCMQSPTCLAQVFRAHRGVPARILALVRLPMQALTASRGTWRRTGPSSFPSLGGLHAHRVASAHELLSLCQRALSKWMSLAACHLQCEYICLASAATSTTSVCLIINRIALRS